MRGDSPGEKWHRMASNQNEKIYSIKNLKFKEKNFVNKKEKREKY
jgi:hypothetical protein